MKRTIEQGYLQVNYWITGQHTTFSSLSYTFLNCRDIFLRNCTTYNLILKNNSATALTWLQGKDRMTVLTTSTGLLGILVIDFLHRFGDGLAICHTRRAYVCLNLELPHHTIHDDVKMKLAHPSDDRLSRGFIGIDAEGWIFFRQFAT